MFCFQELLPLSLTFEVPVASLIQLQSDLNSPVISRLQQQYGVTVAFKQRPRSVTTTVVVRGTVTNSKPLKEATVLLMEHLTGSVGVSHQTSYHYQSNAASVYTIKIEARVSGSDSLCIYK